MATKNSLVQQKPKFSSFVRQENVQQMIKEVVGGAHKDRFVTAIVSAVSTNPALADCDFSTIVSAALLGQALGLSPSPQLGQYYLVPFEDRKNKRKTAQFQLGYKGYIQLAIRSGQYRKLDVIPVKQGELVSYNPFTGEAVFDAVQDPTAREELPTIGYYAFFEMLNGFRKELYWSREQMDAHAQKYSQGYASDLRNNRSYTFWSKNFDAMAQKTMLRQLISKWGIMSIEMQGALESDMQVAHEDGSTSYADGIESEFVEVTEAAEEEAADGPMLPFEFPQEAQQDPGDIQSLEDSFFG